jgi:hypothetical protein
MASVSELTSTANQTWSDLAIKSAAFDGVVTTGDVIAAVTGKKLAILGIWFGPGTTFPAGYSVKFRSGSSADLTGAVVCSSNLGIPVVIPYSPIPWFTTVAGEALTATIVGASADLSGVVIYAEID